MLIRMPTFPSSRSHNPVPTPDPLLLPSPSPRATQPMRSRVHALPPPHSHAATTMPNITPQHWQVATNSRPATALAPRRAPALSRRSPVIPAHRADLAHVPGSAKPPPPTVAHATITCANHPASCLRPTVLAPPEPCHRPHQRHPHIACPYLLRPPSSHAAPTRTGAMQR